MESCSEICAGAFDPDFAAVQADDIAYDKQAEAAATDRFGAAADAVEHAEHFFPVLLGDAAPLVCESQVGEVAVALEFYLDGWRAVAVEDRVLQQGPAPTAGSWRGWRIPP